MSKLHNCLKQQALHSLTVDLTEAISTEERKLTKCTSQEERLVIEQNVESLTQDRNNLPEYPIERLLEDLPPNHPFNWGRIALNQVNWIEKCVITLLCMLLDLFFSSWQFQMSRFGAELKLLWAHRRPKINRYNWSPEEDELLKVCYFCVCYNG